MGAEWRWAWQCGAQHGRNALRAALLCASTCLRVGRCPASLLHVYLAVGSAAADGTYPAGLSYRHDCPRQAGLQLWQSQHSLQGKGVNAVQMHLGYAAGAGTVFALGNWLAPALAHNTDALHGNVLSPPQLL